MGPLEFTYPTLRIDKKVSLKNNGADLSAVALSACGRFSEGGK
jgi:hypothetical protein